MTPSWYDLLDVEPTATTDEIRAAWRAAVAELDPTDRRFRVHNQAAEVLLDPARRASYDEELVAARAQEEAEEARQEAEESRETGAAVPTAPAEDARADLARADHAEPGLDEEVPEEPRQSRGTRTLPLVPGWLLSGVAAVVAVALVVVGVLLTRPSDASAATDTEAAQAAAQKAIVPILSYDAHHLAQSKADATPYMTESEQSEYDKLFSVIAQNAPRTGTVVRAQYVDSGIVRTGPGRVDVLVFVNQKTFNKSHPTVPVVYKNQVTVSMEKVGSDWLVDHLTTHTS